MILQLLAACEFVQRRTTKPLEQHSDIGTAMKKKNFIHIPVAPSGAQDIRETLRFTSVS
jgi:hypothetical protein